MEYSDRIGRCDAALDAEREIAGALINRAQPGFVEAQAALRGVHRVMACRTYRALNRQRALHNWVTREDVRTARITVTAALPCASTAGSAQTVTPWSNLQTVFIILR